MKNKFELLNFYHFRYNNSKILTFKKEIEHLTGPETIAWCHKNMLLVSEMLQYANKDVLSKVKQYQKLSIKEKKSIEETLYKYLSRMHFKPTPFGFFSTVKLGEFGVTNSEKLYDKQITIEFSNVWISDIKKILETDDNIFFKLSVKKSPFISLFNGDIVIFDHESNETEETQKRIKVTPVLSFILEQTKNWISTDELCQNIGSKFEATNIKDILEYLKKLHDLKILKTNIFENLFSNSDKFEKMISISRNTKPILSKKLEQIDQHLINTNRLKDFKSDEIQVLISLQEDIVISKSYVYVNSIDKEKWTMDFSEKRDIERASNIVMLFTDAAETNGLLRTFISHMEKIPDSSKELRVVDLMNKTFKRDQLLAEESDDSYEFEDNKNYKYMISKIGYALLKKEDVILSESDLNTLENYHIENNTFNYVNELELIFTIQKKDDQNIYIYNLQTISSQIGAYFSRFENIFDDSPYFVDDDYIFKNVSPPFLPVKLFHRSHKKNTFDLVDSSSNFENISVIDFTLDNSLSLNIDKLYAKLVNNNIYIIDDDTGSVLLPRQINMINIPLVYNRMYALLYFSRMQFFKSRPDFLGLLIDNFFYCPRIQYKNIIIVKRHWKINYNFLMFIDSDVTFKTLQIFFNQINVPKNIMLASNDESAHYNLDNPYHVKMIFSLLKKYGELTISECDYAFGESYTDGLSNQFVFSLLNKKINNALPTKFSRNKYLVENNGIDCSWITFNLYFDEQTQNDFLQSSLKSIIHNIKMMGINDVFIIRFFDPEPHLRLRLKIKQAESIDLSEIKNNIHNLIKPVILDRFSITDFYPEYHRYGGFDLTNLIIDFFVKETICLAQNILQIDLKGDKINNQIVAYIYHYLTTIFLTEEETYELLFQFKLNKNINQLFIKNELIDIENNYIRLKNTCPLGNHDQLIKMLSKVSHTTKNDIILSIIHMTINRYHIIDRKNEEDIMKLLFEFSRKIKFK